MKTLEVLTTLDTDISDFPFEDGQAALFETSEFLGNKVWVFSLNKYPSKEQIDYLLSKGVINFFIFDISLWDYNDVVEKT